MLRLLADISREVWKNLNSLSLPHVKFSLRLNLYKKLVLTYFFLMLFPIMMIGIFAYSITSSSVKSDVSNYISEVLQQVNDNINNTITELDRMSWLISVDKEIHNILEKDRHRPLQEYIKDDEYISGKLDSIAMLQPYIEGFYIFSFNGEIFSYKGTSSSIDLNYTFTRTRWFSYLKNLDKKEILVPTHLQDYVISLNERKKVFTFVREIVDPDTKKSSGYIMIDIDSKIFKNILQKMNVKNYEELLIIDNNKTILYHTKEEKISTQFRSKFVSELLKIKNGNLTAHVNSSPALVTFNTSPVTNWTVISIIPINILYKKVSFMEYMIGFTVIYFLLLTFIVLVIISYNITKPISDLQALMKKAESGQFDVSFDVKTNDEIGDLGRSFNSMINKINNLIQTVYETRILKKEAELNALQSQINPHFLYNTLQIIDMIAEDEGVEVISSVCRSLSRIFRYSINKGKEIVPLSSEIEHVKNYIYIQKLRFGNRFDVVYDIDESLLNKKIIKLVLQPLVENALLHGIEKKRGKCVIIISAEKSEDNINIYVKDNGVGIEPDVLEKIRASLNEEILHAQVEGFDAKSIGLKNVNARLKLYFGDKYGISIYSQLGQGTTIKMTLPSETFEKEEEDYANAKNFNC